MQIKHREEELQDAQNAIRNELWYQDTLPRRTLDSEAQDVPGYLTLLRVYLREAEEAWARNPGDVLALHSLRKIAAIAVRAMVHCGVRWRGDDV